MANKILGEEMSNYIDPNTYRIPAPVGQPSGGANTGSGSGSGVGGVGGGGAYKIYTPDYGALESNMNAILANFEDMRNVANDQYDINKGALDSSWTNVQEDIEEAKTDNKKAFGDTRASIQDEAFSRERASRAQMAARGLMGSGIEQLNQIQNRMATGTMVSGAASDFYENNQELTENLSRAQESYNTSVQQLSNSLQSALTQIMSSENAARSDYTQMIQNLERQVIADTNSAMEAQRQYELQAASYNMAYQQYQDSKNATPSNYEIQTILESDVSDSMKIAALTDIGYTSEQAKEMVMVTGAQMQTTQQTQSVTQVQTLVNNMLQTGSTVDDVNKFLRGMVANGAINFDLSKVTVAAPKKNTTTTTTTTPTTTYPSMGYGNVGTQRRN